MVKEQAIQNTEWNAAELFWRRRNEVGRWTGKFPAVTLDEMKVRTIKQKVRCLAQNPIASSVRIMQRKRRYGSIRLRTL